MQQTFNIPVGPVRVLTAAAAADPYDEWVDLGVSLGGAAVRLNANKSAATDDLVGALARAGAAYTAGAAYEADLTLARDDFDALALLFPSAVKPTASAIGFRGGVTQVTPRAFALVPEADFVDGSPWWDSESVIWIYNGLVTVGRLREMRLPDANNQTGYPVTITGLTGSSAGGIGTVWKSGRSVLGLRLALDVATDGAVPVLRPADAPTFSRASSARFINDGAVATAAADAARISDDRLLMEPQRTNLVAAARTFAGWTGARCAFTPNAATGVDGAANAAALWNSATGSVGDTRHAIFPLPSLADSADWTLAVDVKAITGLTWVSLWTRAKTGTFTKTWFNLSTGAIGTKGHALAWVEPAVNGFYRIGVRGNTGVGATTPEAVIAMAEGDNDDNWTPTFPSLSAAVDFAQAEVGTFSTSRILTTGASASRVADASSTPFTEAHDETAGSSLYVDVETLHASTAGGDVALASLGAYPSNRSLRVQLGTAGTVQALLKQADGTTKTASFAAAWARGDRVRIAATIKDSTLSVAATVNGIAAGEASIAATLADGAWAADALKIEGGGALFHAVAAARGDYVVADFARLI